MESLEDRIIRHEGFCALPKYDAKGCYVIGFGHDISPDMLDVYKDGITTEQAMALLEEDIEKAKLHTASQFPWILGLDDIRASVIYEMVFQLGVLGVAKFESMIAAIRLQDWSKAAKSMLDSLWHEQTPARCEELANLMLTGEA